MIKIAINGFGRIGRAAFKAVIDKHPLLKVVAINDLAEPAALSHLLRFDSVYGSYGRKVGWSEGTL
jgi:glyceraldehyde 3-phosphate dehydrogenase